MWTKGPEDRTNSLIGGLASIIEAENRIREKPTKPTKGKMYRDAVPKSLVVFSNANLSMRPMPLFVLKRKKGN